MDGSTVKRKVSVRLTTAFNDTSLASSRPSSRNSHRSTSRPPSPSKSTLSISSSITTARPKAKVNSSAIRRIPSTSTTISRPPSTKDPDSLSTRSNVSTTRPASPVKLTPRIRDGNFSPSVRTQQSSLVRVRPSSASSSSPRSPDLRHRSLTASSDTLHSPSDSRRRQGSVVLQHATSHSNLQVSNPSPLTSRTNAGQPEHPVISDIEVNGLSAPAQIKIRSKVTAIAKNFNDASNSPPTPDPSTTKPVKPRTRAPSISSSVSFTASTSPPLPFYPITTAASAANPYRYATARIAPAAPRSTYLPSPPSQQSPKHQQQDEFRPFARTAATAGSSVTKVDPALIPLPPQSPPNSAISISSHSSVSISHSPVSYLHEPGTSPESAVSINLKRRPDQNPQDFSSVLDALVPYASAKEGGEELPGESGHESVTGTGSFLGEGEEHKVKAEAKSNRKIADLEITNRSLLAINASLEKTKDRQAKEIRELKRKLRESRLILPPRAYLAVKSSLNPEEIGDDEEDLDSDPSSDEDEDAEGGASRKAGDEAYRRIKLLLERLLESGRRALEKTKEDFMDAKGGAKVLTAEEVETWRDESGRLSDSETHRDVHDEREEDDDIGDDRLHSLTPQPNLAPPTRGGIGFGLGVSILSSARPSSPKPPPILITESS